MQERSSGMRPGGDRGSFTALDIGRAHTTRTLRARRVLAVVLAAGVVAAGAALFSRARASATIPAFDHVVTVVMQHHGYSDVVANPDAPFLNNLEIENGVATNYFDVASGSLPNALALTGGSTFGLTDRYAPTGVGTISAPNIVDRIEASDRTWKAYFEGMPAPCGATSTGAYAAQSNPFVYYRSVITDQRRCASHVVPLGQLTGDLAHLANYVWISPRACANPSDCTLADNDAWLSNTLPPILAVLAGTNSLVDIVWVSDGGGTGQVAQVLIGASVHRGLVATRYTHYNTLRTVEDSWRLAPLATDDRDTGPESDFFVKDPSLPTDSPASPPKPGETVQPPDLGTGAASAT